MASWLDTVLSFLPVAFWRLDHFPTDTVMTDSSGNGFPGELYQTGQTTFGFPSPIETDPASMALGGQAGFALAADLPDMDGNHTWIVWCYNDGSGVKTGISRNAMWSIGSSNTLGFSAANTAGTRFSNFTESYSELLTSSAVLGDLPVGWYMLTRVRNAAVGQLYVNDLLVDEIVDIPTGSLAPYTGPDTKYAVGEANGPVTGFFKSTAVDEAILFDYALNQAAITAIYESALNSLFLDLISNVIPSAVISSDFPTDPISFPFRWNWAEPPIERLTFRTDVSRARTGAEEGNGQRVAPRREFEFQQVLRNNAERRRLRALLWSKQHAIWFVPVRQDAEQLVTQLLTGATTIPVATVYKDYEVGGYIGLRQYDDSGNITHWEEQLITAVTPVSVESGALVNNYDPYLSWVYPVRRALLTPNVSPQGITDTVETVTLTARLLPEDEAETPRRIAPWSPTLKYRDYEVFDPLVWPSYNWEDEREYEVERTLDEIDFDTGRIAYDADTIGAAEATPYAIILTSRATIAQFLGWFYERKGQLRYLWVPTMQGDFEVLDVDGDELTVTDTNYSDAFALAEPRRDLAFVYHDNSMEFRRVLSFSGTPNETLILDAAVPSLTNLRSVSLLKFSRLDADQLELAWETDSVVRVAWRFRELLHSPEGEGRSSLSPSHSASVSLSASHSPSPSASESASPSASVSSSPSSSISVSISPSPSASVSQSASVSPSGSVSASPSPSASTSPSSSNSPSVSPSASPSPSV